MRVARTLPAPAIRQTPNHPSHCVVSWRHGTKEASRMPVEVGTMGDASGHADEDDVVGLGVPHGEDAESVGGVFVSQEQDELMTEMIMKHRSELQRFVERTMNAGVEEDALLFSPGGENSNLQSMSPPSPRDVAHVPGRAGSGGDVNGPAFDPGFRTPQPKRSKAGERLMQLSRTERTDRMKLAELSDVRNEKLGRAAILRWNPHAKLSRERENRTFVEDGGRRPGGGRERSLTSPPLTTPPRTTAKMLGEYSKDYVQQALDFNNPDLVGVDDDERVSMGDVDDDDDDDDLPPPSPDSMHELLDRQPNRKVKKYMKHMETTIAQLVQQKDELLRNQAEFDKHASGMFPTLETLNNQLSQIVQDRMLQSQANIKDDLEGELRLLRVRLNELEAEAKNRRNDAELNEQKRQLDIAQIKGEIASLGTTGTLQNQKLELLSSQVKRLQQEIQESLEVNQTLTKQYQTIDKRINTLQTAMRDSQPTVIEKRSSSSVLWISFTVLVLAVIIVLVSDSCSGLNSRCHPLT